MPTLEDKQPIFNREFLEREIDGAGLPPEASDWRLRGALEQLEESGEREGARETILKALEAFKGNPISITEAVTAVKALPDTVQVEWYRTLGPLARSAVMEDLSQGNPDTLREFISSGFAVLNFPERAEVKHAAEKGLNTLIHAVSGERKTQLLELSEKIAKLGALADLTAPELWEKVERHIPTLSKSKDAVAFVLSTFPVSSASLEDIVRLPQRFHGPLLAVQRSSFTEVPAEIMRGTNLVPCDACALSRISRELYANYFGTEVVIEPGSLGNVAGFQRAWWGKQEIGYYKDFLEKGEREEIIGTTRHEIDHLETTLLARVRPEEAFATSSVRMIAIDKEDPRAVFPYGRHCRADELRSYLLDNVHAAEDRKLNRALHGKLIHEVLDAVVPYTLEASHWRYYTNDDSYPGQVVARYTSWGNPVTDNFALFVPLPESRGVASPENEVLLEKALSSLREYVTFMGRYHRGEGDPAVENEKKRVLNLLKENKPVTISGDYWLHLHDEPFVIEEIVKSNAPQWIRKLSSGDPRQIGEAARAIGGAFTPPDLVQEIIDRAIEQLVRRPHLMERVVDGMKELAGADWPAGTATRGAVVDVALNSLQKGDLDTFFGLIEHPNLFRSSRFSAESFNRCGEEASKRYERRESEYLRTFKSPGRLGSLDQIPEELLKEVAQTIVGLNVSVRESGEEKQKGAKAFLVERNIRFKLKDEDKIIILPNEDNPLGRLATGCFTGGQGMRLALQADATPHYDYSTHTLILGGDGIDNSASELLKAFTVAGQKLPQRGDKRQLECDFIVRRTDPETGKSQRVYIEDNDYDDLFKQKNSWAVDLFEQFLEHVESEGRVAVIATLDTRNGAWKVSGSTELPSGRVTFGGTGYADKLKVTGLPFDAFREVKERLEEEKAERTSPRD